MKDDGQNYEKIKCRDSSLDLIRIIAFVGVISVHFFLNIKFYEKSFTGTHLYLMTTVRCFFMYCVPTFIMLSGYLMKNRKFTKSHYLKLVKVLSIYFFASIFCSLYLHFAKSYYPTIHSAIAEILCFRACPYSWYVNMYIGLFLIIPFLNIIYNNLQTKKQKQLLLLISAFNTTLPPVINMFIEFIPNYWMTAYPVTCYFIGAYLSDYCPKCKKRYPLLILCIYAVCYGALSYLRVKPYDLFDAEWLNFESLFNTITAVLLFILIKNFNIQKWGCRFRKIIKYLSSLSLGAYLVSFIFDDIYYPVFFKHIPSGDHQFYFMPIMVILIAVSSLCLSAVVIFISDLAVKNVFRFSDFVRRCRK